MAEATYSLSFDGSSGYVSIADVAALRPGSGDFTIALWFKTSQSSIYPLYTKRNNIGNQGIYFGSDTGDFTKLLAYNAQSSTAYHATSGVTCNDGAWHHAAVVRSGSSIEIYVDGISRHSGSGFDGNMANTDAVLLATDAQLGSYLNGYEDDVAYWSGVALTSGNIANLAAGTNFPQDFPTGLVGLWHFNEGSGATTADSSGNSNTGTLTGGVTWSTDVPSQLAGSTAPIPRTSLFVNQSLQASIF